MESLAPYTSPFGGFNYYPTSTFKRSASSLSSPPPSSRAAPVDRCASPAAGPFLRRYRASSNPTLSRLGASTASGTGAKLHSPADVSVGHRRSSSYQDSGTNRKQRARHSSGGDGMYATTHTPAPCAQLCTRPPWSTSRDTRKSDRATSPSPSQFSTGGVTPSAPRADNEANANSVTGSGDGSSSSSSSARRAFAGEPIFLALHTSVDSNSGGSHHEWRRDASADVSVCADCSCIHSRRSIAEFIEMQRELRRCYSVMETNEGETSALRIKLAAAEAALEEQRAQAVARLHEREKELLVEMARREREIEAEVWEQARLAAAAGACADCTVWAPSEEGDSDRDSGSTAPVTAAASSQRANEGNVSDDERRSPTSTAQEALVADMRQAIFQLEDALEAERAERRDAVQKLQESVAERAQLQTHVRLLSAWKEEHLCQQERTEAEKKRLWGQRRLISPTPPRPLVLQRQANVATTRSHQTSSDGEGGSSPTPAGPAETPLQRLLSRGTALASSPSPLPSPSPSKAEAAATVGEEALHFSEGTPDRCSQAVAEAVAAEHLVTIRRSPTPHRPAPAAPHLIPSAPAAASGSGHTAQQQSAVPLCSEATVTTHSADVQQQQQLQSSSPAPARAGHTTATPREEKLPIEAPSTTHSVSCGSCSLAVSEARCRELLRALLDKERQLAVIAAERTLYRRQLNEFGEN